MSAAAFRDQVVIVTGASSGIGEQLALALAAGGARVVLAARRADELERVAAACRAAGASADHLLVVPVDVTEPDSCRLLVEETNRRFGRIDTVIHNAGLGMWARAEEITDYSVFERVMRVNYFGVVYLTLLSLPLLRASRGRIVCVSSLSGRTGVPLRTGYAASKHAVNGFLDSLRIELSGSGVTVTIIGPGWVATGTQARNLGGTGQPLGTMPVAIAGALTAEECAAIVLRAAAGRKREVVIGLRAKIGIWLKMIAPQVIDRMTARAIARGR